MRLLESAAAEAVQRVKGSGVIGGERASLVMSEMMAMTEEEEAAAAM